MVDGIGVNYTGTGYDKAPTGNSQLGKDEFLELLITELRYQDPLDPMKDRDFIAQMAQFSALEQMTNLNQATQVQQATTLIGRTILAEQYTQDGLAEGIYGRVMGVKNLDGRTYLVLDNGRDVESDKVITVLDEMGLEHYMQSIVGRTALVKMYNEGGEVVDLRPVLITDYKLENGKAYIVSGEGENAEEIALSHLWGVA